jgi:hypothetical protein
MAKPERARPGGGWRVAALVGLAALLAAGLAPASPAAAANLFSVDFESYATGPLGSPWFISKGGSSSASIVSTSDHGKVLRLNGGPQAGAFLTAVLSTPQRAGDLTVQFDVKPASGAAWGFEVFSASSRYPSQGIRLTALPGSGTVQGSNTSTGQSCGALRAGSWSRVAIVIHYAARTYDLRYNGTASQCSALPFKLPSPSDPFAGIRVRDYSNDGYGGQVDWDNISGA